MSSPFAGRPARAFVMFMSLFLATFMGCGGETSAPTKIYEGGGTIPEIVDQPETPAKNAGKATQPVAPR